MHFNPVTLDALFSEADALEIKKLLESRDYTKKWDDLDKNRAVARFKDLDEIYSKKLESTAREIFKDNTLKSTYSVYLDYNRPTSSLPPHRDNNACTYTIDYCVSSNTQWPLTIEGSDFTITENQGLAFMGGFDEHGRPEMPDPENNRVQVVMFHFCPADHWYFTEGPDYVYHLKDSGMLMESESYYLSPQKGPKGDRLYL